MHNIRCLNFQKLGGRIIFFEGNNTFSPALPEVSPARLNCLLVKSPEWLWNPSGYLPPAHHSLGYPTQKGDGPPGSSSCSLWLPPSNFLEKGPLHRRQDPNSCEFYSPHAVCPQSQLGHLPQHPLQPLTLGSLGVVRKSNG